MSGIGEMKSTSIGRDTPQAISLDGVWDFIPGDDPSAEAVTIEVPGLWEASGHLQLDGVAWYRRTFDVGET
jgi:hypothetical protein